MPNLYLVEIHLSFESIKGFRLNDKNALLTFTALITHYSLLITHYFYTALRTSILYLFLISLKKNDTHAYTLKKV